MKQSNKTFGNDFLKTLLFCPVSFFTRQENGDFYESANEEVILVRVILICPVSAIFSETMICSIEILSLV